MMTSRSLICLLENQNGGKLQNILLLLCHILYRVFIFKFLFEVGVEESIVNVTVVSLQSKNTNNPKSDLNS
jgi:hypothetical protein